MPQAKRPLNIVHTPCGPLTADCSTCAQSTFARGDRHRCHVTNRLVASDSSCQHWQPLMLGFTSCAFGMVHGQVPEC